MDTLRLKEDGDDSRKDFWSTTVAGLAVAGAFSAWNQVPMITAAKMARMGLKAGVGFGLLQDALHLLRGQRLAYVDSMKKAFGFGRASRSAVTEI